MANTILLKRSDVANSVPAAGNLVPGEVALNFADGNLFFKDSADNVVLLASTKVVTVTGNITGDNIISNTSGQFGNITISGSNINTDAEFVTINSDNLAVDFAVNGNGVANIFYVDATAATVSIGNSTQVTNAVLSLNSTNSVVIPVGDDSERPDPAQAGMLRFNTDDDTVEFYSESDGWQSVAQQFTLINSQTFTGSGYTKIFTLDAPQTTASVIVSINGIVQIPGTAYTVSGTTLTFSAAPGPGHNIEVRSLTTTTSVTQISNSFNTAVVSVDDVVDTVNITGNLIPTANEVYDLGNTTSRWRDLYLSGDSLVLGNTVIKNTTGNVIGFFGPDGTTPGTIDVNNINSSTIANGTANVRTFEDADVTVSAGGNANVLIVTGTGADISGTLSATGNITGGNVSGTNITGTLLTAEQTNITSVGTLSSLSATGNITGGNFITTGDIEAATLVVSGIESVGTLNISGDTLMLGNLTVLGTTVTENVESLIVTDPILGLGSGSDGEPLTSNDGLDRGIKMSYYTNAEQIAFMGYDNSKGKMFSAANVTIANNIVTVNSLGTTIVGVLETSGIVKTGANGVGNVGSATNTFNVVFARATSALYADVAENYLADAEYEPGTVVVFGGTQEVTMSEQESDSRIAGVISTQPSYIMNSGLKGQHVATVALLGRVPCRVLGPISKGSMLVSAGDGYASACTAPAMGTVIGKALENFNGTEGVIEVVVGRI